MTGRPGTARLAALAIDGGTPVRTTFLPYARQQISDDDVAAVVAALRSDWLTTGPRVPAFEAGLADATGARHAIAFSSGTAALHGATVAAGLGPGDEAVTSPLTFAATANAVLYAGADVRIRRRRCGQPVDRARARRGGDHSPDPRGDTRRLRRPPGRLSSHPGGRRPGTRRTASRSSPTPRIRSARLATGGPWGRWQT